MAALLHAGLDPLEALITGGAASGTTPFLRATRGWTDEQWADAEQRLLARGLIAAASEGAAAATLSPAGVELRASIEAQTSQAALAGWTHLGESGTERLVELVRPWRDVVLAADVLPAELVRRRR